MNASRRTTTLRRAARLVSSVALGSAAAGLGAGCIDRPIEPIGPRTTSTLVEQFTETRVDKIDILLTIDDSRSMADKQAILATAVPDLVRNLVNPLCLGGTESVFQPAGPLEQCPSGMMRAFEPVLDINIGVISTSLGPRGSDTPCADDGGRLIHRSLSPDGDRGEVSTYDGLGFLAWDPAAARQPAGEGSLDGLLGDLESMVIGVDQVGCGYEAQLESWYRFLVDPEPYSSIEIGADGLARPVGLDEDLLAQRASFLRADSLVAIIVLSDENDCSFRAEGQGFWTGNATDLAKYQARSECAVDPSDRCCAPCGGEPAGCPADPKCDGPPPAENRLFGLTCYQQKQRFGADLLYPVDRYVTALTANEVPDRQGTLVPNPLLVAQDGTVRPKDRVFLAGIVGVPWQDLARTRSLDDGSEVPDLALGLKSAEQLRADGTWALILGDPAHGVEPLDPHMVESIHPRSGQNPLTGDRIAPPSSTEPNANAINGHELTVRDDATRGDLQYACVFDLPESDWIDCASLPPGEQDSCDCTSPDTTQNPLCQSADGSYSTVQRRAKAYPGLRQLAVLEGLGDQAIVGSICPANITEPEAFDYGYRPTIDALTKRLQERLGNPCLPRTFTPDEAGQVGCIMLEGRSSAATGVCTCDERQARRPVRPEHGAAVSAALEMAVSQAQGLDCFCEIPQLEGASLDACQSTLGDDVAVNGSPVDGWCYVDATTSPPLGNPELVAHCADVERRTIRFLGAGKVENGATLFLTCQQESE